tara:strand:- start:2007 stop:3050 length:1044 start_codon:yes stop_codon:yes gene_type:complete
MPFQKVEFEFPDPDAVETSTEIEIEPSGEIEVEIPGNEKPVVEAEAEVEVEVEVEPESEPEVEIINDVPEKDRNRTPSEPPEDVTKEELASYSEKVQRRIRHFSKGYHDERRAKETAERERDELERAMRNVLAENNALKDTVSRNQDTLLKQARHSVDGELSQAKEAFKAAHESGDTEALLSAQERFTNAKLKADRLVTLEDSPEEVQNTANVQEQLTNTPPPDPKAMEWRKQNTWFTNPNYEPETQFALGLHKQITQKEGVPVGSDEYYEKINSRMREKFPELFEETNEREVSTPKQKVRSVVAPATRSTGPKKVWLNQSQVALSKRLGLTPAQYAKQLALDARKQ